jgi:erythromycin esterase-like protein/predicted phosphoribosyltransferase/pimeloyl-ACP methyl ester carboxylesterase
MRYENREQAGKALAEKLLKYIGHEPVILALPRGGVPIAYEISTQLRAPLDVILTRKIGAPGYEEFAIGAVAEDEKPILNEEWIKQNHLDQQKINETITKQIKEIKRQARVYHAKRPSLSLVDKTVIVVDDGLATGATMIAALKWLRTCKVRRLIVAVPVSSKEAAHKVSKMADEFLCLLTPEEFWSVGSWYREFEQVTDDEVLLCLEQRNQNHKNAEEKVLIPDGHVKLDGMLVTPPKCKGYVLFAHGSGSSYQSPRNHFVAKAFNDSGFGTLLFNLLTDEESKSRENIFDIGLMTRRLLSATKWINKHSPSLPIAYYGASTGAAAALNAAASRPEVFAVVSRGGRPDLAMDSLEKVEASVLLLVGSNDESIIPLNEMAKANLQHAQMILVKGAGHLFEEPGASEEVVEYSVDWLNRNLKNHRKESAPTKESIVHEIEKKSVPYDRLANVKAWVKEMAQHRIVMLGEATHGTKEFYEIRREISELLIQNHGFKFIAVEGDWPPFQKINHYIDSDITKDKKGGARRTRAEQLFESFHRWPTWMWANEEMIPLIEWMKSKKMGNIYGLDVYSLFDSIAHVKHFLRGIDSDLAVRIMQRYNCFGPYAHDEMAYAKALVKFPMGCQDEVVSNLRELLRLRLYDTNLSPAELFDIKQNARIIDHADKYYRAMISAEAKSWNIRDQHMLETLENLLNYHGPDSRAIVWAHNTHIGDYHATDMLENDYINLGGLAREKFGRENVYLVGFGSYEGEVTAGPSWGAQEQTMKLPQAPLGTYEAYFHKAALELNSHLLITRLNSLDANSPLYRRLGHRAVGVVYDPAHETKRNRNYVPTELGHRYDAFMFVDKSSAIKPLATVLVENQFPETWPSGV